MKGIIFDLDGVIVHTDSMHYEAWSVIAKHLNIPFDHKINHRLRGIPRRESLLTLIDGYVQLNEREINNYLEWKNREYLQLISVLTPASVTDKIRGILNRCMRDKRPMAIATSSKNADTIIDKIDVRTYFNAVVKGDDVVNPKPAPDIFRLAAERIGKHPRDCIVVEDSAAGIEAAKEAGSFAVFIGDGDVGADLSVRSMDLFSYDQVLMLAGEQNV